MGLYVKQLDGSNIRTLNNLTFCQINCCKHRLLHQHIDGMLRTQRAFLPFKVRVQRHGSDRVKGFVNEYLNVSFECLGFESRQVKLQFVESHSHQSFSPNVLASRIAPCTGKGIANL